MLGDHVALFTRGGHDCAWRLPRMVEDFRGIPAESCIIDGELVADEDDRIGNVFSINVQSATPANSRLPCWRSI